MVLRHGVLHLDAARGWSLHARELVAWIGEREADGLKETQADEAEPSAVGHAVLRKRGADGGRLHLHVLEVVEAVADGDVLDEVPRMHDVGAIGWHLGADRAAGEYC